MASEDAGFEEIRNYLFNTGYGYFYTSQNQYPLCSQYICNTTMMDFCHLCSIKMAAFSDDVFDVSSLFFCCQLTRCDIVKLELIKSVLIL